MDKVRVKQIWTDGFSLIWKDIKDYRWMMIAIAVYFGVIWKFLHSSCYMVELTGFPCPACGLTRAGFSVIRGEFSAAWQMHPFIYPILCLAILAVIKRYLLKQTLKSLKKWFVLILVLMIGYYVYRMIRYFPGEPPISYYGNNLLRKIFTLFWKK
ncbi:MAG: DUF2752 domain-containing protein [Lachnospiraceae bacterium]